MGKGVVRNYVDHCACFSNCVLLFQFKAKYPFFMVFTYIKLTNQPTNLQMERKTSKRTDGWTESLIEKPRHTQS